MDIIGLCPNHHKMMHDRRYSTETEALIREKLKIGALNKGNYFQYGNNQLWPRYTQSHYAIHIFLK